MVDIITESYANNIKRSFTGIAVNGMFLMNDETSDFNMTDTWTTFGDPSVLIRTDDATEMTISHNPTVIIGQATFEIFSDLDGAYACLSKDGIIIGTATVTGGVANIPSTGVTPGDVLDVAITGFNKKTYLSTVTVISPSGPYMVVNTYNNEVNFGQSINLDIALENVGADVATAVSATVSTSEANSSFTNATFNYGNIAAGTISAASTDAFTLLVANDYEDQFMVSVDIAITSGTTVWNQTKSVKVNAPALSIANLTITNDDNADGILDPGETADLVFSVTNTGHADASFDGTLSEALDANDYLTLNATSVTGTAIVAGASANFTYSVTADATTPLGSPVSVKLDVADDVTANYTASSTQEFNIGIIPIYPISDGGTLTVCTGTFYDSGLDVAEYENNEDYTMTFLPPAGQDFVVIDFTSFELESNSTCNYDYLEIYDGIDVSANLIGKYCGTNNPGTIMGAGLTFKFHSDNIITKAGWEAEVSCFTATEVPACITNPLPANNVTDIFPTKLSWTNSMGATSYDVYFGTDADPFTNAVINVTSAELNISPIASTIYYWAVLPVNSIGTATGCDVFTFETGAAQYLMSEGTVTTCDGVFYDTGGADGQYSSNEDLTMTFMPGEAGKVISIVFEDGAVIEGSSSNLYDKLYAYDGVDATASQFTGSPYSNSSGINIGTLTATNSDGAITFRFDSDGTITKDGWSANISCVNTVGVNNLNSKEVKIYPNPTNGLFTVVTEENDSRIEIYSVNGKLVYLEQASSLQTQVNLSNLTKGIYFIKVSSKKGIANSKIVLQ